MARKQSTSDTIKYPVPLPLKGVNRNFARDVQPKDTMWDALNVLPFDRQGRSRIALRAGAGKVETLGDLAKVRLLHIASYANTSASAGTGPSAPATFYEDDFTYSDGNLTGNGNWTTAGGHQTWVVTSNNLIGDGVATDYGNVQTTGMVGFDEEDDFSVTVNFAFTTGASAQNKYFRFELQDVSVVAAWIVDVTETAAGVADILLQGPDDFTTFSGVTVARTTTHELKLVFDPETTEGELFLDTVSLGTITTGPWLATLTRLFIQGGGVTGTANSGVVRVEDVLITQGEDTPGTAANLNRTTLKLIAVSGDSTEIGEPTSMAPISNTGSFPIDDESPWISAATLFGFTYIVDGTDMFKIDLSVPEFVTYTASAGSLPEGVTLAAAWRGRLVVSGMESDPQNIFASAVGDPTDWDYAATDSPTIAWAANLSDSGRVGAPVLALAPLSDDILLAFCESSVWAVRGDPADGGTIDNISNDAGIVGPNAWCRSADGSVFFVSQAGLWKAAPDGSAPVEISRDVYREFFRTFRRDRDHVCMVYDPTRYGIFIYVTPEDEDSAPKVGLFYDIRFGGFWPIEFTNMPEIGPLSVVFWDGYDAGSRYPVLGGYDGRISVLSFVNRRDNDGVSNVLIEGYAVLGPIALSTIDDAVLSRIDITGGEVLSGDDASVWHMAVGISGGLTPYEVTEGTPDITDSLTFTTDGRAQTVYPRTAGSWFTIRLGNEDNPGDYFSIENVMLQFLPGGATRA